MPVLEDAPSWPYLALSGVMFEPAAGTRPASKPALVLDQETIAVFAQQVNEGTVRFENPRWLAIVAATPRDVFDDTYAGILSEKLAMLNEAHYREPLLRVKTRALADTVRMLAHEVQGELVKKLKSSQIDTGALDAYLAETTEMLRPVYGDVTVDAVARLTLLTSAQVEQLWGLSKEQLAQWRRAGGGPLWVKLTNSKEHGPRYPAVALLAFIHEKAMR